MRSESVWRSLATTMWTARRLLRLLYRFLTHFGVDEATIYIPDRIFEGYGPNPAAIGQLIDNGAQLIVTVDCGSTSHESLALPQSATSMSSSSITIR